MRRTVQWFGVLLLIGGCRCDGPPPEIASAPETVSDIERESSEEAALKENCGVDPEIRKARRAKQIAREAEEARLRALQVHTAEIDGENARQIEALRKRNEGCAEGSARKDPACVAFVEGTARVCTEASGDAADNCAIMGQLGGALRIQEVGRCAGFPERGFRVICEGAITGEFACRKRGGGAMGRACRALAQGDSAPVCLGEHFDSQACNVVQLITAIRAGISREGPDPCASVTRASSRRLCAGWYRGVEKCRRPVGSDAPECRGILLTPLADPSGSEGEWRLRYINLFSESATCAVLIRGAEGTRSRVELGVLASGSGLQEKRIQTPPDVAVPLDVSAECVWDMP